MKEIIIFTNMGRTLHFKNVTKFEHTTQGIRFKYTGVSTRVRRTAEFNNTSMSGYALNDVTTGEPGKVTVVDK